MKSPDPKLGQVTLKKKKARKKTERIRLTGSLSYQ
jgi:hypothetical protein